MSELLAQISIPVPCPVKWETMTGNDTVRDCSQCARKVYNLSAMTKFEAERFLQINGTSQCIQFYRRPDGKIMTERCPAFLRKMRREAQIAASFLAGLTASFFAITQASADSEHASVKQGKIDFSAKDLELRACDFQTYSQSAGVPMLPMLPMHPMHPAKKSDNKVSDGKGWHNQGYVDETSEQPFKEYKKARQARAKNKLDNAYFHYKRSLELCRKLGVGQSLAIPTIEKEQAELVAERNKSKDSK